MNIVTLYSGSSGNCTLIYNEKTKILIDIGKSAVATNRALADLGISSNEINAILLTHEHSDHIKGLKTFNKNLSIPVYGKDKCLDYIDKEEKCNSKDKLIGVNREFYVGDIFIDFFNTSHDSVDSCGYMFTNKNYEKVSVVTDLGEITPLILEKIKGSNKVMIEANYDNNIIGISSYPQYLKARIKSKVGHLSNDDCGKAINFLAINGTKNFMLAHLSAENNMKPLALQTVKYNIENKELLETININVANRNAITYI